MQQAVERREQRRASAKRLPEMGRIDSPLSINTLDLGGLTGVAHIHRLDRDLRCTGAVDTQSVQSPNVPQPECLVGRHDRVVRIDPSRQIPQPIVAVAPGHRDLTTPHH